MLSSPALKAATSLFAGRMSLLATCYCMTHLPISAITSTARGLSTVTTSCVTTCGTNTRTSEEWQKKIEWGKASPGASKPSSEMGEGCQCTSDGS